MEKEAAYPIGTVVNATPDEITIAVPETAPEWEAIYKDTGIDVRWLSPPTYEPPAGIPPRRGDLLKTVSDGRVSFVMVKDVQYSRPSDWTASPEWLTEPDRPHVVAKAEVLGEFYNGRLRKPEDITRLVSKVYWLSRSDVEKIVKKDGSDIYFGYITCRFVDGGVLRSEGIPLSLSSSDLFGSSILLIGDRMTGKTYAIAKLVDAIYMLHKEEKDYDVSVVIFDIRGEYEGLREEGEFQFITSEAARVISLGEAAREVALGFGIDYMSPDDILKAVAPSLPSSWVRALKEALSDVEDEIKKELDKRITLERIEEALKRRFKPDEWEDVQRIIKIIEEAFPETRRCKLLDPMSVTVIDFTREILAPRQRDNMLNDVLYELWRELLRRWRRGALKKHRTVLVFEACEELAPKRGMELTDVSELVRDRIFDLLSAAPYINCLILMSSSRPSRIYESLLMAVPNFVLSFMGDPVEAGVIEKLLGVPQGELKSLGRREYLVRGRISPLIAPIKVSLGEVRT